MSTNTCYQDSELWLKELFDWQSTLRRKAWELIEKAHCAAMGTLPVAWACRVMINILSAAELISHSFTYTLHRHGIAFIV